MCTDRGTGLAFFKEISYVSFFVEMLYLTKIQHMILGAGWEGEESN